MLLASVLLACSRPDERVPHADTTIPGSSNTEFATVPESAWVNISGPTLIAFHPTTSNEILEKDQSLASALDDIAYGIGTAMDSLHANEFTVHYRHIDSVFLRSGAHRWKFNPARDSSDMGYVFVDTLRRTATIYGVLGFTEVIAYAHEFRQTGQIRAR